MTNMWSSLHICCFLRWQMSGATCLPVRDRTQTCGAGKKPSSGANKKSIVPEKYGWPSLLKRDGDELFDHYRHILENLGKELKPEATI